MTEATEKGQLIREKIGRKYVRLQMTCELCSKSFETLRVVQRFCSKNCASKKSYAKRFPDGLPQEIKDKISKTLTGRKIPRYIIEKRIKTSSGENHWRWTPEGSVFIHDATGYKKIKVNVDWVYEHRYILEKNLGRKLSPNEITHHIDGDKLNNSIDNLLITTRSEHKKRFHPEIGIATRY